MRRWIALALSLALLLPLAGCQEERFDVPGNFYYYWPDAIDDNLDRAQDQAIVAEVRELSGISGDVDALLEAYLSGPESKNLESLIPKGTTVLSWSLSNDTLFLHFSEEFAALSGVELSIACACIAKTFLELVPAWEVRIQANNVQLNGANSITLSGSNLSVRDDAVDQLHTTLTVYYADKQRRYLIGQEISINLASEDDVLTLLIEELLKKPEDSGLVSPLPSGVKLLGVRVDDGLCTVDFSPEFETYAFSRCEAQRLTLMSLVNTLCQLETVDQVEFSIEGNLLVQYGRLNIPDALVWEDGVIGPVRTGVNEFDATLYLANGSQVYLTPVPTRIRQSAGISRPELVVRALAEYVPTNCFSGTIPRETKVQSVTVSDGLCRIDLSRDFWDTNSNIPLSVHSIVASVCSLDGIDSVQLTIEGVMPDGAYAEYFLPLSPTADWFV